MQSPPRKFRQNSIVSEKLGYLSEKLKLLTGCSYRRVYYFLLKLRTPFLFTSVYKMVFRIFLFNLDLELLINLVFMSV